jgi:hypothetical protein
MGNGDDKLTRAGSRLLGVTVDEIYGRSIDEIEHGFSVICLKCAGRGGAGVVLRVLGGRPALVCKCGNVYIEHD